MAAVRHLEPVRTASPLAAARLQRKLTAAEAARRAGLSADQVEWLEEGRVYRFPSVDAALDATLLLASALGIDHREARALAGLPVPPKPLDSTNPTARLVVVAAISAAVTALFAFVLAPALRPDTQPRQDAFTRAAATLPPAWKISVDVLNGAGDINYTRQVASRVQALAYTVKRVSRADRFDYPQTAVYYERGGQAAAVRLARQLGVVTRPLPGGDNPRRLVVIVGEPKGPQTIN